MQNQDIARVCHEANRALQIIQNDPNVSPSFDDAPEWQRASGIDGIAKAIAGATPKELHESWCKFKLDDGWEWGAVKDEVAKTHPCLVEYEELPEDQKLKDYLYSAIVTTLKDK
jgi:hypothetical protein